MCKTCSKCHVTYDTVEANFYKNGVYYKSICKTCEKNISKIQSLHKERVPRTEEQNKLYNIKYKGRYTNKYSRRYSEKRKIIDKERVNTLSDSYVKHCIRVHLRNKLFNPTPELIDAYRQMISIKRNKNNFLKQIKSVL